MLKLDEEIILSLRKNRKIIIQCDELKNEFNLNDSEINEVLTRLKEKGFITEEENGSSRPVCKVVNSQDLILNYLRKNRNREIPVSEIAKNSLFKRNTISNAIHELQLKNLIEICRRPLKRGRYTVIWLTGDKITTRYRHKNEIVAEDFVEENIQTELPKEKIIIDRNLNKDILYLSSNLYDHIEFFKDILPLTHDIFSFVTDYITPLMTAVGDLWETDQLSTVDEHVISGRVEKIIIELINQRNNVKGEVIILVSVEGEFHTLSLLALELLLTDYSYKVINLVKPLPFKALIRYLQESETPKWILISITQSIYRGTLKRDIILLRKEFGDAIRIAIGGQGLIEEDRNKFTEVNNIVITPEDLFQFLTGTFKRKKNDKDSCN